MNNKEEKPKIRISKLEFIDWYFDWSDENWIFNDIQDELIRNGIFCLKIEDLFNDCDYIPSFTRIDYNKAKHRGEDYDPLDCILVDDK